MTSKEALEQIKCDLISTQCELFKDNCYDERVLAVYQLDALQTIKQDLERLEALEKKKNCIEKEMYLLIDERDELDQENFDLREQIEKLKQEVKDLENNQETVLTTLEFSVQHNEKLKKAIKLLKYLFDMDLELCSMTDEESIYLLSGDCYLKISSKAVDVDLLKEVLGE